ncbi:unnamed protein product [Closterium sp. NIES-53]
MCRTPPEGVHPAQRKKERANEEEAADAAAGLTAPPQPPPVLQQQHREREEAGAVGVASPSHLPPPHPSPPPQLLHAQQEEGGAGRGAGWGEVADAAAGLTPPPQPPPTTSSSSSEEREEEAWRHLRQLCHPPPTSPEPPHHFTLPPTAAGLQGSRACGANRAAGRAGHAGQQGARGAQAAGRAGQQDSRARRACRAAGRTGRTEQQGAQGAQGCRSPPPHRCTCSRGMEEKGGGWGGGVGAARATEGRVMGRNPSCATPATPIPSPHCCTGSRGMEKNGGGGSGCWLGDEAEQRGAGGANPPRTPLLRPPNALPPLFPRPNCCTRGTHDITLRPSSVSLHVVLPSPPGSSLPDGDDPPSDLARASSPTVTRFLATVVTDSTLSSPAASALVTELVDFAAAYRLDYHASLVSDPDHACPPSVRGEVALGSDVLGDREAISGEYFSQWKTAMDAEMASWKSTGTYVDKVPPPGANIVSGMWIFEVKRPSSSPPAFKARYVARGFSQ